MSTAHTPGPWAFDGPRHNIIVWGPEAETRVCFMTSDGAALANARLIAAAPELLEAARKALNFITNTEGELGITLDSGEALRAAIAKAMGGA